MIRVCAFDVDGKEIKLASMSCAEAERFVEKSKAMLDDAATPKEEWFGLQLDVVAAAMNTASGEWGVDRPTLKAHFDLPTINGMYQRILEFSGLKTTGEVQAA